MAELLDDPNGRKHQRVTTHVPGEMCFKQGICLEAHVNWYKNKQKGAFDGKTLVSCYSEGIHHNKGEQTSRAGAEGLLKTVSLPRPRGNGKVCVPSTLPDPT